MSTFASPCGNRKAGTETVDLVGPGGARTLWSEPTDLGDLPLGDLVTPTLTAGPWLIRREREDRLRLINTATGAARTFRATLPNARVLPGALQPDGRFILSELQFSPTGGYVQRARVVRPANGAGGGRVLATGGTPPRLNATFCGGRLVVLRTKGRRTRVVVGGRAIARLSTPADPRFGCDAHDLVTQASGAGTRLGVIGLPGS